MKSANALFLVLLLLTPACEMLGGEGVAMPNIQAMLAGITDEASAQEAKGPLDAAVLKLQAALANAQGAAADGEKAAEAGAEQGASMVQTVLQQFGIGPETAATIQGLLDNEAVKSVLGATLEQLMGLMPA